MGTAFKLENIVLWNEDSHGIKDFDVFASNAADFSGATLLGSFTAPDTSYYSYPASLFSFISPTNARYVRMTVKNNYTPSFASLGEVAFGVSPAASTSVPEPGSVAGLMGLGLVGLGIGVKKKMAQK